MLRLGLLGRKAAQRYVGHRKENIDMPSLDPKDIEKLIDSVREQTYSVASKQIMLDLLETAHKEYPHEDAFIYQHLHGQLDSSFDATKEWAKGEKRLRFPHVVEKQVGSTTIKITVTHRGRAEEVYGVDVLYEIEGRKAVAFQHKKADRSESFDVDIMQNEKISRTCPVCNWYEQAAKQLARRSPFPLVAHS